MSSYILSIESITDIAESIRYILDNSSNSNCISLNTKELKNQFRNCDGKSGIKPHYAFYDYKKNKKITPAGWLVWSLSGGGCGVVYRRKDGKMIITTGIQGNFCYC